MNHKPSMEEKISFRLFFMGLLSLILSSTLCIIVFHRAFSAQIQEDLSLCAAEISSGYAYMKDPGELAAFSGDGLRITLIEPDGSVLYDSNAAAATMENHLSRPEIQQALANGSGQSDRMSATLGYRTYYYALRLSDGSILRVAKDAQDTWAIYDEALPAIVVSCMLIMALAVLLSWLLCRRLLKPILRMTDDLDNIRENVPYRELTPFVEAIHADRLMQKNTEKLRQEFTANVSHELKTPLTSISGYAELIETGMARPEDIPGFAARIRTEAARMIALVNDILQLSQLDGMSQHASEPPAMTAVDLADIARVCAESLKINAKKAYVSLSTELAAAPVSGDRAMLEELCQNLCDNAIRYNRPGGKVRLVTGRSRSGQPFLTVEDNGIGIPQEAQSRVFERFYRVDKSHSKATGGTGLGLAIVKHIAIIHSAHIELESQLGEGTRITVSFPPQGSSPA